MPSDPIPETSTFARDGAERFHCVLSDDDLSEIKSAVSLLPMDRAGIRLTGIATLNTHFSVDGKIGKLARSILGAAARPVRAVLFDKTPSTNWRLKWHQDRTIAVQRRVETEGYGPWSIKSGLQHVAPPFALLARMVTIRVHLDDVDNTNAPLLVAPGSHRLGRVAESDISIAVDRCGICACLAEAGDAWLYATPILHASDAASRPSHRRVLQIDYSADRLPEPLEWLGV